jgi:thiol:disulfide interchange protein DsbD
MNRPLWHLIPVRPIAVILSAPFILCAVAGLALFAAPGAPAQTTLPAFGDTFARHHTQVKLILSAETAKPGDTIWAGVDMKMDPGWHTYWKNPGEAGSATTVAWTLPAGVSVGEIQWPLPQKLPPAEVTTYGYEDEVILIVPLTLATNLAPGPLTLSAKVSWLECKDACIPANQTVEAGLNVGSETKPSADAAVIELWRNKTPQTNNSYSFQAAWEKPANGDTRPLLISHGPFEADKNIKYDSVDFFPAASDNFEIQPATEVLSAFSADLQLRKLVKKFSGGWPREISGTIVIESGKQRYGYDVIMPVSEKPSEGAAAAIVTSAPTFPAQPLWRMLLYAFIGGLILNIMPCVLPVIALKILGFVGEARSEPRRVRVLGLIYTLGVLVSFLALAGVVIGVKAAGHHAGWGMQFGSPVFVVCLTTLVLLVALNLFGVFEVSLGGRALDTASGFASKTGAPGAFFNGVLATTLATPCTAPFLAPALGFAFAQNASLIVLIFLTVGLGLSAPYLVLSWQPGWLKFLPKPGVWMDKFKNAMGFPMLATVVWLYYVASSSYGQNVLWLGVFLVLAAFAAWIFGEFFQRGRRHRLVAALIALLVLLGGYGFALEKELDWRGAVLDTGRAGEASTDGIAWQPWSAEAVAAARAAGRPVLVDFTADWCLTCQVNRKTSLENSAVREKLKAVNAVAMVGDCTHFPEAITTELSRYDRAGVPLVLVYPKNPNAQPAVLPAILTPGIVLSALDRAK